MFVNVLMNQTGGTYMDLPVVSLFSGAMGLDLGVEKATNKQVEHQLRVTVTQEFDPTCVRTIQANGYKCVSGDIRQLVMDDPQCRFLMEPAGIHQGEAFLVIGGPPCQPFSTAGRRQTINDPRGSLFREFVHVINTLRPRFFIMENVKGLLSSPVVHVPLDQRDRPLAPEEQPGSAFAIVKEEFQRLGYHIVHGLLDAVHYGVPQFRERLFIIGSRDHEDIFLPIPTHFRKHQNSDYQWKKLRWAIEDLEVHPGPYTQLSRERLRYLQLVPMGGNWRDLPGEMVCEAMGGAYKSGGGKAGFYRRLHYDQPSPTLVTSPTQKATMLCHPTQDRPLSVKEYARIQGFPDDWKFEGSITAQYKQIGNAVPIGLGSAVAQALLSVAFGTSEVNVKRIRGTSVHDNLLKVEQLVIGM